MFLYTTNEIILRKIRWECICNNQTGVMVFTGALGIYYVRSIGTQVIPGLDEITPFHFIWEALTEYVGDKLHR